MAFCPKRSLMLSIA